jgi:hypothetical protein
MENYDQKPVEVQVANEIGGTREAAQGKSKQDGVLNFNKASAKINIAQTIGHERILAY